MSQHNPIIKVAITSGDRKISQLCLLYWQVGRANEFTYDMKDLARQFNVRLFSLPRLIKDNSYGYFSCEECGKPVKIFYDRIKVGFYYNAGKKRSICDACR